jgi:hypothetical protein
MFERDQSYPRFAFADYYINGQIFVFFYFGFHLKIAFMDLYRKINGEKIKLVKKDYSIF